MYTEQRFTEEMTKIFVKHNLKIDHKDGRYYFEKIPRDNVELVENDIRNVMRENNWRCMRVVSGDCITVTDFNFEDE